MQSIVGTWRLVRGTATAADGTAMPPPYGGEKAMGRLTFDADGRMICVLCDGRPSLPPGVEREYNSYCGNYTFDGRRLVTRVDACSDPGRLSADQVRDVSFEGEIMVFRPPLRSSGSLQVQRALYWERISKI